MQNWNPNLILLFFFHIQGDLLKLNQIQSDRGNINNDSPLNLTKKSIPALKKIDVISNVLVKSTDAKSYDDGTHNSTVQSSATSTSTSVKSSRVVKKCPGLLHVSGVLVYSSSDENEEHSGALKCHENTTQSNEYLPMRRTKRSNTVDETRSAASSGIKRQKLRDDMDIGKLFISIYAYWCIWNRKSCIQTGFKWWHCLLIAVYPFSTSLNIRYEYSNRRLEYTA